MMLSDDRNRQEYVGREMLRMNVSRAIMAYFAFLVTINTKGR
jgi:hypothetical protein